MNFKKTPLALALAALLALGGCAGGDADTATDGDGMALAESGDESYEDDDMVEAEHAAPTLTADSLAALERGLARENEGLQAALDKLNSAESDAGKLMALAGIDLKGIAREAADAAGLSDDDYGVLKDKAYEVLGAIEMREMMETQIAASDTTGFDAAMMANHEKAVAEWRERTPDPLASMDPALADAFRARQSRLAELRAQNIGLVFKFIGS